MIHPAQPHPVCATPGGEWFATTHWSQVVAATNPESPEARAALERLCQSYWPPLYTYARRKGQSPHDAQDLVQEFFARLLAGHLLETADRRRGRFRAFLLGCFEHFLAKEWTRSQRLKRGGGVPIVSLDERAAERGFEREATLADPVLQFDRAWAVTMLNLTLQRLRAECEAEGRAALFEALKGLVAGQRDETPYSELAARLSMTEGALRVALHRLRQRYGEMLREEVAHTVGRPEDVDGELRHLLAAVDGGAGDSR